MIHTYELQGLPLKTGDLICTTNGQSGLAVGEFWRLIGYLVPGDVDHVVIYIGPEGRCVESAAYGVNTFEIPDHTWNGLAMLPQRGFIDQLIGIAYPFQNLNLPPEKERQIRERVGEYCLAQATAHKPYNLNFLDSETENAFYCSQLAYKAYIPDGINLNTGLGLDNIEGTETIILPQEIWDGCAHRLPVEKPTL